MNYIFDLSQIHRALDFCRIHHAFVFSNMYTVYQNVLFISHKISGVIFLSNSGCPEVDSRHADNCMYTGVGLIKAVSIELTAL